MAGIDGFTKLMLHCNGADTSTTFTDDSASAHTVTASGDAQIDTAQSKFGGASGLFDASGDWLSVPDSTDWHFGSGDFTLDFWVRFNVLKGTSFISQGTGGTNRFLFNYSSSSSSLSAYCVSGGVQQFFVQTGVGSFAPAINTWYHMALVRDGNTLRFFVGGTQVGSGSALPGVFPDYSAVLYIGRQPSGINLIDGWMDEIRVSKGIARWTANFTPQTEEYTEVLPINKDTQFDYHLGDLVSFDTEFDYHIGIGPIFKNQEFIYNITRSVIKENRFEYHLGEILTKDNQFLYDIIGLVTKDLEAIYDINDPLMIDYTLPYNIGSIINKDAEFKYQIVRVLKDFEFKYTIGTGGGGTGVINKDTEFLYNLAGTINKDSSFLYNIGSTINKDNQFLYDFGFINKDFELLHNNLLRSGNPTHMQSNLGNLVLRLHLNEAIYNGTLDEVKDTSGFNNHGITSGSPTVVSGKFGSAIHFTGASSLIIPDSNQLDLTSAFSILFWIKPETYNYTILSKDSNYDIALLSSGNLRFGNSAMGRVIGLQLIPLNIWSFIACVFTYNELKIYINGEIDNALSVSKNLTSNTSDLVLGGGTFALDEINILNQRLEYANQIDSYLKQPTHIIRN